MLERENEKIKKELESANAQITSLRNVMSTIVSSDKINLIQDKMDLLNLTNSTSNTSTNNNTNINTTKAKESET